MLSTAEVCLAVDRSTAWVTLRIRQGRLPAKRLGRTGPYRIAVADLLWFAERERIDVVNPFLLHVEP